MVTSGTPHQFLETQRAERIEAALARLEWLAETLHSSAFEILFRAVDVTIRRPRWTGRAA